MERAAVWKRFHSVSPHGAKRLPKESRELARTRALGNPVATLSAKVLHFVNTVSYRTVAQALVPAASALVPTLARRLKNTLANL